MTRPLRSPPITGGSSLLRAGPPADATTVLSIFRFSPVDALPLTTARGFARLRGCVDACLPTFRAEAADRARATFTPGTTWPVGGRPPGLGPGLLEYPGFDAVSSSRRVNSEVFSPTSAVEGSEDECGSGDGADPLWADGDPLE